MAFAFMDIQKIKTEGQLTAKYNHNCRKIDIDNVIPELSNRNEDLVQLPMESGKELNYYEAFKKRIDELPYYQDHQIRKNAVKAFEVLMTFSRDENIDIEAWKKQSVQWLKDTFDVAPDGKSNILHVAYHADETGNVHAHAIVVPIDERGHLNARRFTDGSRVLSELQTSYAKSVENLGLERGLAGSSARHQDIRRMYASLNRVLEVPEVNIGESASEYRERILDDIKTSYAAAKKDIDDNTISEKRAIDMYKQDAQEAMQRELEIMQRECELAKQEEKTMKSKVISYEDMLKELSEQLADIQTEIQFTEDTKEKVEFYDKFQSGMEVISMTNPESAELLQEDINYIMQAADEYESRKDMYEEQDENIDY